MISKSQDILYFITVAETLNLSRAAEKIGVGQPTLSQAIKRLEESVGVPLLIRQRVGVQLTKSGQTFLERSKTLLADWAELAKVTNAAENSVEGTFTIGCHPAVAMYSFDKFLPPLLRQYAKLDFKITHGLSRVILEQVVSFKADFGLVINPVRHPDLVLIKLCEDKVGFWKSRHALNSVLIFDPEIHQCQHLIKKLRKSKIQFERTINSNQMDLVALMASSGCGVAILPERVAQRYSNLEPAGAHYPHYLDELYLVYRADRQTNRAAKVIIAAIKKAFTN